MTTKTQYLLPAFVAIFALMFVVATPYVAADEDDSRFAQQNGKRHMPIQADGFEGSIPITEDSDRQEIKSQKTVSLSEASAGIDVHKAHLGVVVNENDDKFLVWILANVEKDSESETAIATIFVVDAGDLSNTATITKEIDLSEKTRDGKRTRDGDGMAKKIERLEERFSEPTGNEELDELQTQFFEKIQELKDAHEEGDSDKVQELRKELKELREQLIELRSS
jgi:hypothetical protein